MKLRIAMVAACPYPVPQGSQVLFRTTAEAVRRRGHDVHLVVYGYGAGEDDGTLPVHRCRSIPGMRRTLAGPSWGKPLADAALVATLRRVIREQSIDIVHAHNYEGLIVALAARNTAKSWLVMSSRGCSGRKPVRMSSELVSAA